MDRQVSRDELLAENERLARRIAELEAAIAEVARTEEARAEEARTGEAGGAAGTGGDEAGEVRRLLEAVMDAVPGTLHVKSRDDRYQFVNRFFLESWGLTREACIGRTPRELFPGYGLTVEDRDHHVIATKRPLPFYEVTYPPRDGESVVVLSTKVPLHDAGGEVTHVVTVGLDITELKRAQARQAASEAQMRAVVESAADAILIADPDGQLVDANPAAETGFRFGSGDIAGRSILPLLFGAEHGASPEARWAELLGALDRRPLHREITAVRADGETFPAELTVARVPLATGTIVIATVRDLTERRRAEAEIARQREALHHSEKLTAMGSLLASVAHELNNPLSIVVAQSVLLQETSADRKMVDRGTRIRAAAERCGRIVRTFLAMARRRPPEMKLVSVNDVIASTLELVGYGLRSAGIEVRLDFDPDLPLVMGDADHLNQVLSNLVVNAQQAMMEIPGVRRLGIRTETETGTTRGVRITVEDSGPGVPEDIARRIFEPFFTTKPTGAGTGIGLAVCRDIVTAHGGRIELATGGRERPGGGARFEISLTAAAVAAAQPAELREEGAAERRTAILVVDDEAQIAETLAEILDADGHEVETVDSGLGAMDRISRRDYGAILTDLRMPGMDGMALYSWIEQERPHLLSRMVFITGDMLGPNASAFLSQVNCPRVEKPFLPSEIRRAVARVLAESEAIRR